MVFDLFMVLLTRTVARDRDTAPTNRALFSSHREASSHVNNPSSLYVTRSKKAKNLLT